jgi:hypothetical protein
MAGKTPAAAPSPSADAVLLCLPSLCLLLLRRRIILRAPVITSTIITAGRRATASSCSTPTR